MNRDHYILLVEDNEDDVFLFKRSARGVGLEDNVRVVGNGELALNYLRGQGPYQDRGQFPLPTLILLDIKLPKLNGFDVLKTIRSIPEWTVFPVVMLTSSREERDTTRAMALGANAYVCKPSGVERQEQLIRAIRDFWFKFHECSVAGTTEDLPTANGSLA